jgi:PAS domain S-box-containing protein
MLMLVNEKKEIGHNSLEESLSLLADTAIFTIDSSGLIQTWNSGAEKLLGLCEELALGKNYSSFFMMEDVIEGKPEFQLKVAGGPFGRFEEKSWKVKADGSRFYARALLSPLRTDTGELRGFIHIIRDISDSIKQTELEDAVRIRDEFLSLASHELRTPLTKILMQLQMIRRQPIDVPEKISKSLNDCETATKELASLMDNLVDVSRLRLGKLQVRRTKTNIVTVLKRVLEKFNHDIRLSGNHVHFRFEKEIIGYWDQGRLEQLFSNLLSNALKFGEGRPIDIFIGEEGENITFKIRDEGLGIPYHLQPKIFERFERAVDPRKISGLGLGLYVCRQIVVAHGGVISLDSSPGRGATFIVTLPLKKHA